MISWFRKKPEVEKAPVKEPAKYEFRTITPDPRSDEGCDCLRKLCSEGWEPVIAWHEPVGSIWRTRMLLRRAA